MNANTINRRMAAVRQKDTEPEMVVRRLLHQLGYRYRLHVRDLPSAPDIVFRSRRKVILVHGCFWHRHACSRSSMPATHVAYWQAKFERTIERDKSSIQSLRANGWEVLVVWECQTRHLKTLQEQLVRFLDPN